MTRSRIRITETERRRRHTVAMALEGITTTGSVVVELPEYAKRYYQEAWARDYSHMKPEDAEVFQWLDDEADSGEFHRGPMGHGIIYYSKKGTAAYDSRRS